jgi:hypothetical protein
MVLKIKPFWYKNMRKANCYTQSHRSFMSETTAYLIPKKHFDVGEFEAQIKAAFERLEMIDGYYNEDNNWFAAGDSAHLLFADSAVDDNPPFEYIEIHDTENKRLLPEGCQEPVDCPFCQADISEAVNDFLFENNRKGV